jgi:hypothetical protein
MDDKDFYAFRKSLDHQRDIEFDERHWEELDQRIKEGKKNKRRPLFGWWMAAAAAVLALLLGNIYLFGSLRQSRLMNEQLGGQIEHLAGKQTDTIWKERVVYVYDTIENEKIVYMAVAPPPGPYQQLKEVLTPREVEALLAGKLPERLRAFPGESAPAKNEALAEKDEIKTGAQSEDMNHIPELLEKSSLGMLEPGRKHQLYWSDYLPEVKWEEKKTPFLLKVKRAMQPDGLAIGVSTGALFPLSRDLHEGKGFSTGLAGELVFSEHLRLRMEANYARVSFTSDVMAPTLGIPVIQKPGDDFVFTDARAVQNALHFNLGMKYLMNVKKKLQPFVFAGFGSASVLPYSIYYDFDSNIQGIPEVTVPMETENTFFISGFGIASAGISYNLNNHLSLQLEGLYRTQLSKSSLSNPDLASLRATAMYQF